MEDPKFENGKMIAEVVQLDQLRKKDIVLVMFESGDAYVGLMLADDRLIKRPDESIMNLIQQSYTQEHTQIICPKMNMVKHLVYLGVDNTNPKIWDLIDKYGNSMPWNNESAL